MNEDKKDPNEDPVGALADAFREEGFKLTGEMERDAKLALDRLARGKPLVPTLRDEKFVP